MGKHCLWSTLSIHLIIFLFYIGSSVFSALGLLNSAYPVSSYNIMLTPPHLYCNCIAPVVEWPELYIIVCMAWPISYGIVKWSSMRWADRSLWYKAPKNYTYSEESMVLSWKLISRMLVNYGIALYTLCWFLWLICPAGGTRHTQRIWWNLAYNEVWFCEHSCCLTWLWKWTFTIDWCFLSRTVQGCFSWEQLCCGWIWLMCYLSSYVFLHCNGYGTNEWFGHFQSGFKSSLMIVSLALPEQARLAHFLSWATCGFIVNKTSSFWFYEIPWCHVDVGPLMQHYSCQYFPWYIFKMIIWVPEIWRGIA